MSEPTSDDVGAAAPAPSPASGPAATAGGLLREARLARGMHIAALANAIKVTPQKLEALEADRFDELPGAAFTRALAQTVCRTLKIDPGPVMALLPSAPGHGLEHMSRGINEPFRDRPGRQSPADFGFLKSPVRLGAIGLVILAVVLYLLPAGWVGQRFNELASGPAQPDTPASPESGTIVVDTIPSVPVGSPASEVPVAPDAPAIETVHSAPPDAAATAASVASPASPVAPASSAPLQLRATAESWVEVIDRRGVALFSRMLQPGETVGLDGAYPLRLRIGNAQATEVSFKGERVDLAPLTSRDNVAKLELK